MAPAAVRVKFFFERVQNSDITEVTLALLIDEFTYRCLASAAMKEKKRMRRHLLSLPLVVLFLLAAPSLYAAVRTLDPVTDPLGDCSGDMTADQCMSSNTTTSTCTDSWGCPQCGMTQDMTCAVCYKILGNYGFCSCTAYGTYRDKYGQLQPDCRVRGACNTR